MQARAGAIDELIASGALEDASSLNQGDDIARELEAMSSQSDVEAELARLKGGSTPPAIEGGQDGGDILEAAPETISSTTPSTESSAKDPQ
jgi:phage shock protein A